MPAIITHHLFGLDVLTKSGLDTDLRDTLRQAFLLGCQGPDPFFFVIFDLQLAKIRRFGSDLHDAKIVDSLDALRKAIGELPSEYRPMLEAYILGWLCHFSLDSQAHPLVIYFEKALCSAGVFGLDQDARSMVHAQIESDIDSSLLYRRTGQTIKNYRPVDETAQLDDLSLYWISQLYSRVAYRVFDLRLPEKAFLRGYHDMRLSYKILYSPNGTNRAMLGSIERLARKHSLAQAVSHRVDVGEYSDFDNHQHDLWINPYTGESHSSSFEQLYETALSKAIWRIGLLETESSSSQIIGGLNFLGSITL